MRKLQISGFYVIILLLISACVPHKKMIYVQDEGKKPGLKEFKIEREITETIQPGDMLYITVSSSDDRPTNFSQDEFAAIDVTLRSYEVNDDGTIRFPYLGSINVQGKSVVELTDEIEKVLTSFITNPSVIVRFVNKNITVVGEVNAPGVYTFYDKNINVLQAIAYAGDITTFGNRKSILLIREEGGKITKHRLDLTEEHILVSTSYIVKPDDIIYVEPLRIKQWGFETFPYELFITLLNTTLILWSFSLTLY